MGKVMTTKDKIKTTLMGMLDEHNADDISVEMV